MTTLESLSIEELTQKLSDPLVQEAIDLDLDLIIAQNSPGSALTILKKIEPAIQRTKLTRDAADKYEDILTQLKFVAFRKLNQEEAFGLVSTKLMFALINGTDVYQKIKSLFSYESGDFKTTDWLLRSMESNNEVVGGNIVATDGKQYAGLVGNYIRQYKVSPGFKQGGALGVANFLTSDRNTKQLDSDKTELLRQILSLYDWVRLKALSHSQSDNSYEDLTDNNAEDFSTRISQPPATVQQSGIIAPTPRPISTPPPPRIAEPRPAARTESNPAKELTSFEKKLAEIDGKMADKHSSDLEVLKQRLEGVGGKMINESKTNLNNPVSNEIKREVRTTELPAHTEPKPIATKPILTPVSRPAPPSAPRPVPPLMPKPTPPPAPRPVAPAPKPSSYPTARPTSPDVSSGFRSAPKPAFTPTIGSDLKDIKKMQDLKNISLSHLRQGPIQGQIQVIKSKILELAQANRLLPYYAVVVFEQSPLFQTYVASGNSKMETGELAGGMTHQEFEAVADLKKQVEGY